MGRLTEITDLFVRLASSLENSNPTAVNEDQAFDVSISNLNQSLNLNDNSRVRVLDTALSLMCFKSPQVFDSMIEYLVKAIVSVLSSSVSCSVLRFQKEEVLWIGSSISSQYCWELIEVCTDVLGKLKRHVTLSNLLVYAVVKVVVSAPRFRFSLRLTHTLDVKSNDSRITNVSKLLYHLPKGKSIGDQEIPLRLLLWYLDPLILKNDMSQILKEVIGRPFLCLNLAIYERMEWRCILFCLVLSPSMFIEVKTLLHSWFLMTGLSSVLELQIELVSLIRDVVSRPMWWGISMELGLKLPFSHAYFPHKHDFLRILAGPLSGENLQDLVHVIHKPVSHARRHSEPIRTPAAAKSAIIDHKSVWALAMNFPCWFYFASALLFSEKGFPEKLYSTQQSHMVEPSCSSSAAASYIAWILSPISESHQALVYSLTNASKSWTSAKFSSKNHHKEISKLKKPKLHDKLNPTNSNEYDCKSIRLWLSEFQVVYRKYWNKASAFSIGHSPHGISLQKHMLYRRIPLGILIGCTGDINDDACILLLHYAATSMIPHSAETRVTGLKHRRLFYEEHEDSITCIEKYSEKEAVAGACLVFSLTDIAESMSISVFENEKSGVEFICRVKLRVRNYLFNCVKKILLEERDGLLMLRDLCSRLVRWRNQGRDMYQRDDDLDDIVKALSNKLSNFQGKFCEEEQLSTLR